MKKLIQMPATGKFLELIEVPDEIFSTKMMGDGFAIEVTDGKIVAPFDGIIKVLYPTGHAIILQTSQKYEILIHLGLESFALNGKGINNYVKVEQSVKQGDLIAEIDVNIFKDNSISTISPIIFLGGENIIFQNTPTSTLHNDILEIQIGDTNGD